MQKKLRLVEVEWLDSCSFGGWRNVDVYQKEAGISKCRTVGYLLESSRIQVKVVQSMSDQGTISDSMSIPRSAVRKITTLVPRGGE